MKNLYQRIRGHQGSDHRLFLGRLGLLYLWKWCGSVLPEIMWMSGNFRNRIGRCQFHNGMGFEFQVWPIYIGICTKGQFGHWMKEEWAQFYWKGKKVWGF